jgi:hypothetical protein
LALLRKASFDRRLVEVFSEGQCNILEVLIQSVGINELLSEYFPSRHISLLALDVEGHELEILSELDFLSFSIDAVLFETWHLYVGRDDLLDLLQSNGYVIYDAGGDALAVKR